MLEFYTADNLNSLYEKYSVAGSDKCLNPLQKKHVVVPNMAVGRWLTMRLAERQGICANFDRSLPASLAWQLKRQLNPDLPEMSDFDQPVLLYRILALLNDEGFCRDFSRLWCYLESCEARDILALAQKLARIFDHYQHYRGDWLNAWAEGRCLGLSEDEPWQQAIWHSLTLGSEQRWRGQLQQELVTAITEGKLSLPACINVFGVSNLAPDFIGLLKALAGQTSVRVFALSHASGALPHWCLPGHELIELLGEPRQLAARAVSSSSLSVLQRALATGFEDGLETMLPQPADDSIALVSCFSPMREVEALRDNLLNAFAKDPTLEPGDVLVAMPKIDEYAPFIRAVFAGSEGNNIPFNISSNLAATESPLVEGLQTLLQLGQWRFTREEVLMLLRNRLVQQKYQITDRDFEQINAWLDSANVRWGIDAEHRRELNLPATDDNTWRQGLDRLLLGFTMPVNLSEHAPLYEGILPVDEVDSSGSLLLSKLVQFCECLFAWRQQLDKPKNMQAWQQNIQALVDDFFVVDSHLQGEYLELLKGLDTHSLAVQQAASDPLLDCDTLALLLTDLTQAASAAGRLSGSVTFTGMSDLQGIPYKQVCMLGLNYDTWPSKNREPGFDLLNFDQRVGDRNRPADDRYTSLQLIQAASERVYISYVGRNIASADEIPPSVLVTELSNLASKMGISVDTHLHAIHPFSSGNFNTNTAWKSHSRQWLAVAKKAGRGQLSRQSLFSPLPLDDNTDSSDLIRSELTDLNIDDFMSFYKNPQRHFLRNQLGIYLQEQGLDWLNDEPFDLSDNFADSSIRQQILQHYLQGYSDSSDTMLLADGVIPTGELGSILLQQQREMVDELTAAIEPQWLDASLPPVPIQLDVAGVKVQGSLPNLKPCGQVTLQAGNYYDYQRVEVWLRHLLLCAAKPEGVALDSRVLAMDGVKHYSPQLEAKTLLEPWVEAYRQGQQQPLPFFAKSSGAYAKSFAKGKTKGDSDIAMKKAVGKWCSGYKSPGDEEKLENVYLYRQQSPIGEQFSNLAESLIVPAIDAEGK